MQIFEEINELQKMKLLYTLKSQIHCKCPDEYTVLNASQEDNCGGVLFSKCYCALHYFL